MPVAITYKSVVYLLIAVVLGGILSFSLPSQPVNEQLINLAVEQDLSYLSLKGESLETKAILLDYADNQELVLTTWLAVKKYPKIAEQVFLFYGQEPEFKQALLQFGDGVIPVVDYFLKNEVTSLTLLETTTNIFEGIKNTVSPNNANQSSKANTELTPQRRGWYAVNYINQEGYNFLGQFAIDKNGNAQWLQSDRVTKALGGFFTSGIRDLEAKVKTDEEITKGDILWAGVDVFVLGSSLKLLKVGKVASSGKLATSEKSLSLTKKTSVFSSKLIKNKTIQGLLKQTAIGATLYIAVTHPSIINSLLDEAARLFGLSPLLVKLSVWSIIILVLLPPLVFIFNKLARPIWWIAGKAVKYAD